MTCPICGRLYCDHSASERLQTLDDMLYDMYAPHIIDNDGLTKRVTEKERDEYLGKRPSRGYNEKKK